MDEAARGYIAALGTRIAALTRARADFVAGRPGAAGSIERLARMLQSRAATLGYARVAEAAARVDSTAPDALLRNADELLAALSEIAATRTAELSQAHILVVDDDPINQTLIGRTVASPTRRLTTAGTIDAAEKVLAGDRPALVILDLVLPDGDGRNFLLRLRDDPTMAAIPVIVVSGLDSAQVRSECYALGCDAYFVKPLEIDVLSASTTSLLERTAGRMREARVDALTGLPNRAALRDAFARLAASGGEAPATVAMLDLDHFRQLNDALGTAAGDDVLRAFGAFVRAALRPSDVFGRWGGEEFVALFPGTSVESAAGALATVQQRLASHALTPAAGDRRVQFTAGVAACGGATSAADALVEAERLLFHGKASGRNTVVTSAAAAPLAARTVMLAEDDPVIAALVRHRIERDGFDFEHFANGTDALARAERGQLGLVILDVNMPGIGGVELLKKLRQMPVTARTPIMMLTAMGSEADIARALALGANDYVVKPFSPVELLARVRRLVARA